MGMVIDASCETLVIYEHIHVSIYNVKFFM